jgi:16S rRNA (cytosine967-C5)-methyltransferase
LDPQKGETILDVCAAPGTKTNYIFERMNGDGHLFASDISSRRLLKGKTRATDLKLPIKWLQKDASVDEFPMADRILIDAPCTGTGVIARRPDIRWRRKVSDFDNMNIIQTNILNNMSKYLKPKGTIVYATCSLEKEENWDVVSSFLELNDNFIIKSQNNLIPKEWINNNKCLEIFPPNDKVDGMFAVNIQKI